MFIEMGESIVDINEICAVTDIKAVNLIRSISYEFKIIFKSGQHLNISSNSDFELKQMHGELVAKLKQKGVKCAE